MLGCRIEAPHPWRPDSLLQTLTVLAQGEYLLKTLALAFHACLHNGSMTTSCATLLCTKLRKDPQQQLLKFLFECVACDRFAVAVAFLVEAQVIGIVLVLALAPASGERLVAIAAVDGTAQDEVFVQISTILNTTAIGQTFLDLLKGFPRN